MDVTHSSSYPKQRWIFSCDNLWPFLNSYRVISHSSNRSKSQQCDMCIIHNYHRIKSVYVSYKNSWWERGRSDLSHKPTAMNFCTDDRRDGIDRMQSYVAALKLTILCTEYWALIQYEDVLPVQETPLWRQYGCKIVLFRLWEFL